MVCSLWVGCSVKIQWFKCLKSWKSGITRFNQIIQINAQNTSQIAGKGALDFKVFRGSMPPWQERAFGMHRYKYRTMLGKYRLHGPNIILDMVGQLISFGIRWILYLWLIFNTAIQY